MWAFIFVLLYLTLLAYGVHFAIRHTYRAWKLCPAGQEEFVVRTWCAGMWASFIFHVCISIGKDVVVLLGG